MELLKIFTVAIAVFFTIYLILSYLPGKRALILSLSKTGSALRLGLYLWAVLFIAAAVVIPVQLFLLVPNQLGRIISTLVSIALTALAGYGLSFLFGLLLPSWKEEIRPGGLDTLISTLILCGTFYLLREKYDTAESLIYAAISGFGLMLVLTALAAVNERLSLAPVPKPLKGYPALFILASMLSLTLIGLTGMFR